MISRLLLLATFACWLAIILGTHLPREHIPKAFSTHDKLMHAAAYASLTTLVVLTWRTLPRPVLPFSLGLVVALLAMHAFLDEATQQFVPGRSAEFGDWLADVVGILVGVTVAEIVWRYLWPAPLGAPSTVDNCRELGSPTKEVEGDR